jgi:hypothetical protein
VELSFGADPAIDDEFFHCDPLYHGAGGGQ